MAVKQSALVRGTGSDTPDKPSRLSIREIYRLGIENPTEYFRRVTDDKLEFRRSWLALWTMTSDPDVVQHVLLTNAQNYRKSMLTQLLLEPLLGKFTLFTSEGARWKTQRRLAAPVFSVRNIEQFAPLMVDEADRLLKRWDGFPDEGQQISVQSEMAEVTLRIIMRAMYSKGRDEPMPEDIADTVQKFVSVNVEFVDLFGLPKWIPRLSHLRLRAYKKRLNDIAGSVISERRRSGENKNDLLGLLMAAVDEDTGRGMTVAQLQDEVRSYIVAGYETTATTLTWVFYALLQHPEVEAKLHAELDSVLNGRLPELADLENLPYTLQVIQETMRVYTVVPSIAREANAADEIKGVRIPKNAVIQINIWYMHRDPKYWKDPEVFMPERFSPEHTSGRHRFSYLPFSGGPRVCIGAKFSLLEAQLILASIAQRWRLRAAPDYVAHPVGQIVLQPQDGFPVTLERRK